MKNFKVYNIKINFKKMLMILIFFIILILFINLIFNKVQAIKFNDNTNNNFITNTIASISTNTLTHILDKSLIILPTINKSNDEQKEIHISVKNILKYELATLNNIIEKESLTINEEELTTDDKAELLEYSEVKTEVQESIVKEKFSDEIENVKIKNTSDYDITDEIIKKAENNNYTFSRNVMIFHTHTCESYTSSSGFEYTPTGNFRTTDLKFSVARVGEELKNNLEKLNFNVIHDKTYHDFPAYSGSYDRSYETVDNLTKNNKDYEIVFDLHRDAIGSSGEYAPTVKIGDEYAAQLMFVIGTNAGGLEHPNWENNLSFAIKVQKKANELYPGLFKPIMISNSRFNQNLARGACIIEVGATGNTLEQAINSMKYLSIVLDNVI